jgi:hypothetical protein
MTLKKTTPSPENNVIAGLDPAISCRHARPPDLIR